MDFMVAHHVTVLSFASLRRLSPEEVISVISGPPEEPLAEVAVDWELGLPEEALVVAS